MVDVERLALEHRELARPHIGGGDEHARRVGRAQALEIHLRGQDLAQGIVVQRVRRVGAGPERPAPELHDGIVRPELEHAAQGLALRGPEVAVEADLAPEPLEGPARALGTVLQPAIHHHDRVHGARARPRDRLEAEAPILDQRVEDAPGEGAMRTAALEGQRHRLLRARPRHDARVGGGAHRQVALDRNVDEGIDRRFLIRIEHAGLLGSMLHRNIWCCKATNRREDAAVPCRPRSPAPRRPPETRHRG